MFKNVLSGIKNNLEGINIPTFERVEPENATPEDVRQVLNDLRAMKNNYSNPQVQVALNLQNIDSTLEALGRSIDEIETLPGFDFQ